MLLGAANTLEARSDGHESQLSARRPIAVANKLRCYDMLRRVSSLTGSVEHDNELSVSVTEWEGFCASQ
jgi:hypothetical protein